MSPKPIIFIVGNSRSGTTLMAQILNYHTDIHVLKETYFMEEFAAERKSGHFDKETLKNIVNRMLTMQKKGYCRNDEVDEYPETETIVNELSNRTELSFKDILRYLFHSEVHKHGKKISSPE